MDVCVDSVTGCPHPPSYLVRDYLLSVPRGGRGGWCSLTAGQTAYKCKMDGRLIGRYVFFRLVESEELNWMRATRRGEVKVWFTLPVDKLGLFWMTTR